LEQLLLAIQTLSSQLIHCMLLYWYETWLWPMLGSATCVNEYKCALTGFLDQPRLNNPTAYPPTLAKREVVVPNTMRPPTAALAPKGILTAVSLCTEEKRDLYTVLHWPIGLAQAPQPGNIRTRIIT
jgi:hypothetical protein